MVSTAASGIAVLPELQIGKRSFTMNRIYIYLLILTTLSLSGCATTSRISDHWDLQPDTHDVYKHYEGPALPIGELAVLDVRAPISIMKKVGRTSTVSKGEVYFNGKFAFLPGTQQVELALLERVARGYTSSVRPTTRTFRAKAGRTYATFSTSNEDLKALKASIRSGYGGNWNAYILDVTDERAVVGIARSHRTPQVRAKAVGMLSDEKSLKYIAENDEDAEVRVAAVKRLNDQELLARIALNDESSVVRRNAVMRLTDPEALKQVVEQEENEWVREAAQKKL